MRQHGGEQSGLVTLTFDLESDVRVTCDVGYLCANFGLPRPLCSRLRPDVRDRQTDVRQHHRLMPLPIRGGHNKELRDEIEASEIQRCRRRSTKTQIHGTPGTRK